MNRVFVVLCGCILFIVILYYLYSRSQPYDECIIEETISTPDGIIQIVDEQCKEGMPHTTDANTIRMSRKTYDSQRVESVLVHERIHLSQKRDPQAWKDFYAKYWNYEISKTPPTELPDIYIRSLRPNPDTSDTPWAIWEKRYVFFPNSSQGKLRDAKVIVWDIVTNKEVPIPTRWKEFFCNSDGECPSQYEHPHEITAEFITDTQQSTASSHLYTWIEKTNVNKVYSSIL